MWVDDLLGRINATVASLPCATECSIHGLSKQIEKDGKRIPAVLIGNEWKPLAIDDRKGIQIYHRQLDYRQEESDLSVGNDIYYAFTLNLRMFGLGVKPLSCNDSNQALAVHFAAGITNYPAIFTGIQLLSVSRLSINSDFQQVFSQEFPDAEIAKYVTRGAAFYIDYQVTGVLCVDPCEVVLA